MLIQERRRKRRHYKDKEEKPYLDETFRELTVYFL
jgi:hypothetical protein